MKRIWYVLLMLGVLPLVNCAGTKKQGSTGRIESRPVAPGMMRAPDGTLYLAKDAPAGSRPAALAPAEAQEAAKSMRNDSRKQALAAALLAFASGFNAYSQTVAAQPVPQFTVPQYTVPQYPIKPATFRYAGLNRYHPDSLSNPYGAGSPYKADAFLNPYSRYGSRYSNESWNNPFATNAPKLVGADGTYLGRWSANKFDPDSTSNPFGRYGNQFSSESINNPFGKYGNQFSNEPVYVVPGDG